MSDRDTAQLLMRISELEDLLREKQDEVFLYQKELIKFSQNLDLILSTARKDSEALKQLQRSLVPTEYPQFPGFEISRKFIYGSKFGGDYFDIFTQKDKMHFGVLLSSSSSYGMSANFLSVVLSQHRLLEGGGEFSVADTLMLLSDELKKIANEKDESQVFYAQVDRRLMTMTFACVGTIYGFILGKDEPLKVISSDSPGIKSGVKLDINQIELSLDAGTRVCLCSQGITEILDVHDIAAVLEKSKNSDVHEIRNQLIIESQLKSGLDTPIRDQTVIVMDVKDNVFKLSR